MMSSDRELSELLRDAVEQYPVDEIGDGLTDNTARKIIQAQIPALLTDAVGNKQTKIDGSVGQGRWTAIPWVAIMDRRETTSTRDGLYVVYLFEPQERRVRLSLAFGVTDLLNEHGKAEARSRLQKQTRRLRRRIDLSQFSPGPVEFPHASNRNDLYGRGTVYYTEYRLDDFPSEETVLRDLESVVGAYREVIGSTEATRYYWLNSADLNWDEPDQEKYYQVGGNRRNPEAFHRARPDDRVLVYRVSPTRAVVGTARVADKAHGGEGGANDAISTSNASDDLTGVTFVWERSLPGVEMDDLEHLSSLRDGPIVGSDNPYVLTEIEADTYETVVRLAEQGGPNHFWVTSNARLWDVQSVSEGTEVFYTAINDGGRARNQQAAFEAAGPGDRVLFYSSSESQVVGIGTVVEGLHEEHVDDRGDTVRGITLRYDEPIDPIDWSTVASLPAMQETAVVQTNSRGALFELSDSAFDAIQSATAADPPDPVATLEDRLTGLSVEIDLPDTLYYESPAELRRQIQASLNSGQHIIFTGPPGTGKTKLAKHVCEQVAGAEDAVDGYQFTTATAEWTTFDTIGGYVPNRVAEGDELVFQPRLVLDCFRTDDGIKNEWLVIDEINRSDIDKAFGQLFSVLSGDSVQLPYERDDPVEIAALDESTSRDRLEAVVESDDIFPVTPSWRLLATMNTYDKTSLYELSYAFMRRFNFIHVGVPPLETDDGVRTSLLDPDGPDNYATAWLAADPSLRDPLEATYEPLAVVWHRVTRHRTIGPSIVRDMLEYLAAADIDVTDDPGPALTDAVVALVFPQLEGMAPQHQRQLVEDLTATGVETESGPVDLTLDGARLERKAEDFFDLPPRADE